MAQLQPVSRTAVLHRTSPTLAALADWGCCLQSPQGPLDSQAAAASGAHVRTPSERLAVQRRVDSSRVEQLVRKWLGKLGPGSFPSCLAPGDPRHAEAPGSGLSGPSEIPHLKRRGRIPASDANEYCSHARVYRTRRISPHAAAPSRDATLLTLGLAPCSIRSRISLDCPLSSDTTDLPVQPLPHPGAIPRGRRPRAEGSCEAPSNSQVRRIISAHSLLQQAPRSSPPPSQRWNPRPNLTGSQPSCPPRPACAEPCRVSTNTPTCSHTLR